MNLLVAIVVFGLLIGIHETGHFLVARWAGMRVELFSIGFGPALLRWRMGETEWRLAAFPLGGYVKIAGMNPLEEGAAAEGSFARSPAWKRLLVILAGAAMNYLLAFAILVGLFSSGAVTLDRTTTRIGEVMAGMPAEAAGLRPGDRIERVAGAEVEDFQALAEALGRHPSEPIALEVEREGRRITVPVTPSERGQIGVVPPEKLVSYGLGESIGRAALYTVAGSLAIVDGLVGLVRGDAAGGLMGPVGIASEVARQAERGVRWLLGITVNLSIALGFFNLLPIPALDGGRALFILVELVRRKPVDAKAEAWAHAIGFLLLLALILVVTVGDVGRLFRG